MTFGNIILLASNSPREVLISIAANTLNVSDEKKQVYRIGHLANEFGVSLRTLRFYEDRGLISPKRSGSTRLYSSEDRSRLQVILLAKRVGFSLVDIQELLEIYDGDEGDLSAINSKFDDQLKLLKAQKEEIEVSIDNLTESLSLIDGLAK